MNQKVSAFVFRTRGLYMFVAIAASMVIKSYAGGTTTLLFLLAGLVVIAAVQCFRTYSASYLWGRQAVAKIEADFLCTAGPYGYIRNPLYLGNFLIGIGLCIAVNEWYAYALFIASYAFVYSIVIPYEEKFLQERFGTAYTKYKTQTRRLVPRLKPYRNGEKVNPNFKAGILGEIHVPIILAIISISIYLLYVR